MLNPVLTTVWYTNTLIQVARHVTAGLAVKDDAYREAGRRVRTPLGLGHNPGLTPHREPVHSNVAGFNILTSPYMGLSGVAQIARG